MRVDPASAGRAHEQKFAPAFRSDHLADLRRFLDQVKAFKDAVGPLAEFCIVADTNILLYEVVWPLKGRRQPDARTGLQEAVAAGTIVLYATPQVMAEVDRNLPERAAEYGLDIESCVAAWSQYKPLLRVREADTALTAKYASGEHPADAPTLALAEGLGADAVLSKDNHIRRMGGTAVKLEFVLEARNYSRQIVISASIRVGGCLLVLGAVTLVKATALAIKAACASFGKLPGSAMAIASTVIIAALLYPKSREYIVSSLSAMGKAAADALPIVLETLAEIAELEAKNRVPAPVIPKPMRSAQPRGSAQI